MRKSILFEMKLCNSFTEGDYCIRKVCGIKSQREKLSIIENLVFKFHCAMTCCVAINAKEGDCWIQLSNYVLSLMLHKFHISCQSMLTKLTWLARRFL